jgi:hypothetical protein
MCSDDAPPAPDYTPLAEASKESSAEALKLSREQFDWAKETYAQNKATTDKVVDMFLSQQSRNDATAQKDRARYESIFQPLEDSLAKDAADYASPERRSREMGRAVAGVGQQFNAVRESSQRNLEAYGINPAATRYQALDVGIRAQEGAAKAAASAQAAERVDATGRALRSEAINVGRGYPGQIAGQYGTSQNAGNSGTNNTLATTASGANTMGTGTQWAGVGNQALNTWGNMLNTGYNNQMSSWKADQESSSGWGSLIGGVAGMAMGGQFGGKLGSKLFAASGGAIDPAMMGPGMSAPQEPTETDGGAVPAQVSPSGGRGVDDVEARLSVGEFIMPDDVTRWYGEEKLHKMIIKAREGKAELSEESGAIPTMKKPAPAQAIPT